MLLPGRESALIGEALTAADVPHVGPTSGMVEAVALAAEAATDTVLLAPGCSSFDGFVDEFDRGGQFIAEALTVTGTPVTDAQRAAFRRSRRPTIADLLATP